MLPDPAGICADRRLRPLTPTLSPPGGGGAWSLPQMLARFVHGILVLLRLCIDRRAPLLVLRRRSLIERAPSLEGLALALLALTSRRVALAQGAALLHLGGELFVERLDAVAL